jgi:hypothetical protein
VLPADDPDPDVNQVTEGDPVAAVFVSSFVKQDWVGPDGPETRSWDDKWTGGEEIGIYMIKKSDSFDLSKAMFKNKKYKVKASADPDTPPTGEIDYDASDKMYYPIKRTTKVQFVAYCPYDASGDDMAVYTFTNQDTKAGKEAADFIFHKGTETEDEYSSSSPTPVKLKFQHRFSKIRIEVRPEEGVNTFSILNLNAELTGMPTSATVDLKKLAENENDVTAAIAYGTPLLGTIKPYIIGTPAEDKVEFEAIVPPHSGTGAKSFSGREFIFKLNDRDYIHPLSDTTTFRPGKEYKYELTLKKNILNVHDGLSNCYLVKPGEPVTIPITRAITIGGLDPSTANADITLVPLWDDNSHISSISELTDFADGNDRKFTVTTSAEKGKGSAVVALKVGTTIYWSWHIWVIDPDEIGTWTNENNGLVFMDRHLGATETTGEKSWGHAYQWGRKDPFPWNRTNAPSNNRYSEFSFAPVDYLAANMNGAARTMIESIRNPKHFFAGGAADWLPFSQYFLWNTSDNLKGVYDPCPVNWRVPKEQIPWTLNQIATFPWTGVYYRSGIHDAPLRHHGTWTAFTYAEDIAGAYIAYNNNATSVTDHDRRPYPKGIGLNVRCVIE